MTRTETVGGPLDGYTWRLVARAGDTLRFTEYDATYLGTGRKTPRGHHEALHVDPGDNPATLQVAEWLEQATRNCLAD